MRSRARKPFHDLLGRAALLIFAQLASGHIRLYPNERKVRIWSGNSCSITKTVRKKISPNRLVRGSPRR